MKEATGELNMTVVTVVAIAAIGAFFYLFIWPSIQTSLKLNQACTTAGDTDYQDEENGISCTGGVCTVDGKTKTCVDNKKE